MRDRRRLLVVPLVLLAWLVLAASALGGSGQRERLVSPRSIGAATTVPATSGGGALDGNLRDRCSPPSPTWAGTPTTGLEGSSTSGRSSPWPSRCCTRGLARAGYRIVWLDFGWASGKRDRSGEIVVDRHQWPHGLRWLTDWLHRHGLLAGIYTDAGKSGCHGQGVGSLGHYQQDADRFAAWGFDAVKVDFCGAGQAGLAPKPAYMRFAKALAENSSHRTLLLNVCNFWVPGQINGTLPTFANSAYANYRWAPRIAQSWRTDTDIGFNESIQFVNVLRNLDHDAAHPTAAGPGHWNDPDYLGPGLGMTSAEAQAQFSMWAIVAAPLMLGSDPRALPPATIKMLENRQVIAVDQDPLGIQGTVVEQGAGSGQAWSKPLAGGAAAVALLNRGAAAARDHHQRQQGGAPLGRELHDPRSVGGHDQADARGRSARWSRPTASFCTASSPSAVDQAAASSTTTGAAASVDHNRGVGPLAPDDLRGLHLVAVDGALVVDHVGVDVARPVVQDQPLAALGQPHERLDVRHVHRRPAEVLAGDDRHDQVPVLSLDLDALLERLAALAQERVHRQRDGEEQSDQREPAQQLIVGEIPSTVRVVGALPGTPGTLPDEDWV